MPTRTASRTRSRSSGPVSATRTTSSSRPMGALLVAGGEALFRVTLDGQTEVAREVVVDGLPAGGHSTKTVEVFPDGQIAPLDRLIVRRLQRGRHSSSDRPAGHGRRHCGPTWWGCATRSACGSTMRRAAPGRRTWDAIGWATTGRRRPCTSSSMEPMRAGHAAMLLSCPIPSSGTSRRPAMASPMPAAKLPAHTAPLALVGWDDHLAVALHGSWNSSVKVGYKVVVATLGRRAGRPGRGPRDRLPARRRPRCTRSSGRPGGRSRRSAVRLRRQGRVHLSHHRHRSGSAGITTRPHQPAPLHHTARYSGPPGYFPRPHSRRILTLARASARERAVPDMTITPLVAMGPSPDPSA